MTATDAFIQCLIYRQVWDFDQRWNSSGEVKKVRVLKLKKEKKSGLKDSIQIHYKELGLVEDKTTWSNNANKKSIPELQDCLIEIIIFTKQWHIPE